MVFAKPLKKIRNLNKNIITIKRTGILDKENEIQKLEAEKESKRKPYKKLKEDIVVIGENLIVLEKKRQDIENQKNILYNDILEIKVEIRSIEEKLKVYKSYL